MVLNSKEVVHGTYGGEDAQARVANRTCILGVALFSKGNVAKASGLTVTNVAKASGLTVTNVAKASGLTVTTALAVAAELVKRGVVRKSVFTTGDIEAALGAVQAMKVAK